MNDCKKKAILASIIVTTLLSGCGTIAGNDNVAPQPQTPVIEYLSVGDSFLKSNLKIKSTLTDMSVTPSRTIKVELYVDKYGNGQGVIGIASGVYDVIVSGDHLYVKVADNNYVRVSDVTGRLVSSAVNVVGATDMVSLGFRLSGAVPVGYAARNGSLIIETQFGQSTNTFNATPVNTDKVMTLSELSKYIADYNTDISVGVEEKDDGPGNNIESDVKTFYLNSPYGVQIDGRTYSIGDTCNPSTYFGEEERPEGVLYSNTYKQDKRVDFVHISYLATNGRASFTTMSDYVQSIWSNADWNFLDLKNGMTDKDVKYLLGYKLGKSEQETWSPMDEDFVFLRYADNVYYCELGILKIEIRMASGFAKEIYVEQALNFKK